MRRIASVLLAAILVAILVVFGFRAYGNRDRPLPSVTALPEMEGLSCPQGLEESRELSKNSPERAESAYFWLIAHCTDDSVAPEAFLEVGSLLTYRLKKSQTARSTYSEFLRRFPNHASADVVLLNLAQLELDDADYESAVSHLTQLAKRYPDSLYRDSAAFLAGKAEEMLVEDQRSTWTLVGQIDQLVPNNTISFLLVLTTAIPAIMGAFKTWDGEERTRRNTVKLLAVLVCVLVSSFINYLDKSKQETRVSEEIAALR